MTGSTTPQHLRRLRRPSQEPPQCPHDDDWGAKWKDPDSAGRKRSVERSDAQAEVGMTTPLPKRRSSVGSPRRKSNVYDTGTHCHNDDRGPSPSTAVKPTKAMAPSAVAAPKGTIVEPPAYGHPQHVPSVVAGRPLPRQPPPRPHVPRVPGEPPVPTSWVLPPLPETVPSAAATPPRRVWDPWQDRFVEY